jgi:hypothetical protein
MSRVNFIRQGQCVLKMSDEHRVFLREKRTFPAAVKYFAKSLLKSAALSASSISTTTDTAKAVARAAALVQFGAGVAGRLQLRPWSTRAFR